MAKYIVNEENTLGYPIGEVDQKTGFVSMVVMAVDLINGGDPMKINRSTMATNWREAVREDEDRFKVHIF